MINISTIIENYVNAHNKVSTDRKEEELYLSQIVETLQEAYPELKVKLEDGYITIGSFTTISMEDLNPLINLGLTNFHIDSHLGVKTRLISAPTYYNNLMIHIDVDKFNTTEETEDENG